VFELTPDGSGGWTEILLYAFQGKSDGSGPNSALVFDEAGNLYGTAGGGVGGIVYKVTKVSLGELSPASLSFPSQPVGFASNLQATTLKNGGSLPMTVTSIQITGADSSDFRQSSNCPATLPPTSSCVINVSFEPTTSGTRNGVLSITDSAINTPQTVPLTGMGQDFSMAPSSGASATVTPGKNAQYTIALTPLDGFSETVALSCTGEPAMSTCSVSPSSWKLNGSGPTPVAVLVATTASSAGLIYPGGLAPANSRIALWLAFSGLPAVVLLGTGRKRRRSAICGVLLLCVLSLVTMWSACGGGSGMGGSGTPTGTYTLTVTGTYSSGSANLAHSTKLTLVVE
jgi:Abnormal spindle-like microcephaly-assoc'd, ASPM-SPD-2-Hydin